MAKVKVGAGRSHIESTSEGLRITIPSKKNYFMMLFLGFWLMGWAFGEVTVLGQILDLHSKAPRAFLIPWLGLWSVGGAFAIFTWLWSLMGKEVITLTSRELQHQRVIAGFNRSKEYDLKSIRNLRSQPAATSIFTNRNSMEFWGISGGTIAFDYGNSTHRFGAQLDEAEAEHVISAIKLRSPGI